MSKGDDRWQSDSLRRPTIPGVLAAAVSSTLSIIGYA